MNMNHFVDDHDLSDVVLDGVKLVSDDPQQWFVCRSMQNTSDLFEWWEAFAEQDDIAWRTFKEQMAELRSLRDRFDELSASFDNSINKRRVQREIFVGMLQCGFDIGQVAALCNTTSVAVTKSLVVSRTIDTKEAVQRLDAERLLRVGRSIADTAREVGLTDSQVWNWSQTLGIQAKPRNRYASSYGPEIRARAMVLYDSGMVNREIVKVLKDEFPEFAERLNTDAISQWAHRSGRTAKRKSA